MTTEAQIKDRLREIVDPCSAATGADLDIVEMGLVKSVNASTSPVTIEMRLTTPACHMIPYFHEEITTRVGAMAGVEAVELEVDNGVEWSRQMMTEEAKDKRQRRLAGYEPETQR